MNVNRFACFVVVSTENIRKLLNPDEILVTFAP